MAFTAFFRRLFGQTIVVTASPTPANDAPPQPPSHPTTQPPKHAFRCACPICLARDLLITTLQATPKAAAGVAMHGLDVVILGVGTSLDHGPHAIAAPMPVKQARQFARAILAAADRAEMSLTPVGVN